MFTLAELCISFVLEKNIPYLGKLGEDMENKLQREEVNTTCSNTVTKLKFVEEERDFDPYAGYMQGIAGVLQTSNHIIMNAKVAEECSRKNVHNCGFFGNAYMLYYLRQEADFHSWFKLRKRQCWNYDKSGDEARSYVVYEMPVF